MPKDTAGGPDYDPPFDLITTPPDTEGIEDWSLKLKPGRTISPDQGKVLIRGQKLTREVKRFFAIDINAGHLSSEERAALEARYKRYLWEVWSTCLATIRTEDAEVLATYDKQLDQIEADILQHGVVPKARRQMGRAARISLMWAVAVFLGFAVAAAFVYNFFSIGEGVPGSVTAWSSLEALAKNPLALAAITAISAMVGRFVSFLALYRDNVTSVADYDEQTKEIPHHLGPIRDALVAVFVFVVFHFKVLSISIGEGVDEAVFATVPSCIVMGTLVGLVLPLVVDRMIFSARNFAQRRDQNGTASAGET